MSLTHPLRLFLVAPLLCLVAGLGLSQVSAQGVFRLDRVAKPSADYQTVSRPGLFQFRVPANWSEHPWGDSVAYTPDGAYFPGDSQSQMTHGIEFGISPMKGTLVETTRSRVGSVAEFNPHLRERAGYQTAIVSGREALVSTSTGKYPFTGLGEIIVLYTAILPDGSVFHISTDVPDVDFTKYQPVFDNIIRSIRFLTNSSVRAINSQSWQIVLDGRDNWFDTGITLADDQNIVIEASGQWSLGGGAPPTGPEGMGRSRPGLLLESANLATLLGRVGGTIFGIGRRLAVRAPEAGTLFLSMNDLAGAFADNLGNINILIRIENGNAAGRPTSASVTGYVDVVEPRDSGCRIRIIAGERLYNGVIDFDRLSQIAGQRIRSYDDAVRILNGRKVTVTLTGLTYAASGVFEITFGGMGEITFLNVASDDQASGRLNERNTAKETIIDLSTDILFDFNKAEIKPEAFPTLLRLAQYLRNSDRGMIQLNGFTDAIGSSEYNLGLSGRRATAVKQWLVAKGGVSARRLQTRGLGEAQPVAPNTNPDGTDSPSGRQKNRRVEIRLPRG